MVPIIMRMYSVITYNEKLKMQIVHFDIEKEANLVDFICESYKTYYFSWLFSAYGTISSEYKK